MNTIWPQLKFLGNELLCKPLSSFVEIIILAVFIYYAILFIRGTRAVAVLRGALLLAVLFGVAKIFHFETINLLYERFAQFVVFCFIVMFAPELRRALIAIGRQTFMRRVIGSKLTLEPIADAVRKLVARQIGALVAIERSVGLRGYARSGVMLDADISSAVLMNIFYPKAPLHDGGVIIENGRILAAACIFPLSSSSRSYLMGTRHRAALGISEETDALVICVSEESGKVSIFEDGKLDENVSVKELSKRLAGVSV